MTLSKKSTLSFLEENLDSLTEKDVKELKRIARRIQRQQDVEKIEDPIRKNIGERSNLLLEKAIMLEDLSEQINSFGNKIPLKLKEITALQLYNLVLNEKSRTLEERRNLSDLLED